MKKILYTLLSIIYGIYTVFGMQGFVFAKSDYIHINKNLTQDIDHNIVHQVEDIISDYKTNRWLEFFGILSTYAQSSDTSVIKQRITDVVSRVDGKITPEVKNNILTIITNKIKTISDATLLDIWVHFLREIKRLRVVWEIVNINTPVVNNTTTTNTVDNTSTIFSNVDFVVDFASITVTPTLWQKFATVRVRIKNIWDTYVPTSNTMLKFGCKGIDGNYYAYWTYNSYENISKNWELIFEIPNVTISNLTTSPWYKILSCKVNPDNITPESNYENNTVSIPFILQ